MQSLREGLFYVWHMPTVLLVIGVVGMIALFGINFNVMLPLFATDVFDAGPVGYGFISAAYGLGALFSALWSAFALSHFYTLSFPLLISVGCAQIVMAGTANTTIQMVTPNSLRGRAISVHLLVYTGSMPLGNLLAGA